MREKGRESAGDHAGAPGSSDAMLHVRIGGRFIPYYTGAVSKLKPVGGLH